MGKFVLKDAKVLFSGRDLSGELSSISLEISVETPEKTAFGDGTRTRLPGIIDISATHSGWWDIVSATDDLDSDLLTEIGAASSLMSMTDSGGTLGDISYALKIQSSAFSRGGSHGEIFAFTIAVSADGPVVRGVVMENSSFTATADGTKRQVGAISATQSIYSSLHVTSVSGTSPTLDVIVESDATNSFSGSETTRLTHPQFTATGANQQILAGAVTDDWWRLVMTITGSDTPTFNIFGSLAIQATLT